MPKTDSITFDPRKLEEARLSLFLTRNELAARARVSTFVVWSAHNGRAISLPKAKAIAKAVRRHIRNLIEAEDEAGRIAGGSAA